MNVSDVMHFPMHLCGTVKYLDFLAGEVFGAKEVSTHLNHTTKTSMKFWLPSFTIA
jgi:hypothetical protein